MFNQLSDSNSKYCELLNCKLDFSCSLGYFNLSEWKAPIFPNFLMISRILEGSYLSEFQKEGGSNLSEFWTFYVKNAQMY